MGELPLGSVTGRRLEIFGKVSGTVRKTVNVLRGVRGVLGRAWVALADRTCVLSGTRCAARR
jgi:hypothetical protein